MRIWVRSTGLIQAAQIIRSSGEVRLDGACAAGVIAQPMMPATVNHEPVDQWVTVPIKWVMEGKKPRISANDAARGRIPQLADQALLMDPPYYPEAAIKEHQEGVCRVHVEVSAAGDFDDLRITKSSGDARLDRACLDTLYAADFIPPREDGKAVAAATDVYLAWRLPKVK